MSTAKHIPFMVKKYLTLSELWHSLFGTKLYKYKNICEFVFLGFKNCNMRTIYQIFMSSKTNIDVLFYAVLFPFLCVCVCVCNDDDDRCFTTTFVHMVG